MTRQRKQAPASPVGRSADDGIGAFVYGTLAVVALVFALAANTNRGSIDPAVVNAAPSYTSTAAQPVTASLFNPPVQQSSAQAISLKQPTAFEPQSSPAFGDTDQTGPSFVGQKRTVAGRKVPLLSEARTGSVLVDRLNGSQAVTVTEQRGDWVRVQVSSTLREGWMPAKRLGGEPDAEPQVRKPKPAPALPTAVIVKRLIADSLASYDGSCPCPYNSDRAGRSCGRRSAHSRPGGAAPLCFASDVTPDMIAAYRENHAGGVIKR